MYQMRGKIPFDPHIIILYSTKRTLSTGSYFPSHLLSPIFLSVRTIFAFSLFRPYTSLHPDGLFSYFLFFARTLRSPVRTIFVFFIFRPYTSLHPYGLFSHFSFFARISGLFVQLFFVLPCFCPYVHLICTVIYHISQT